MATLADLVKRQRQTGASRTGALFTAMGQKTLAAIDPRKMFNQTGLLTAMFPSLKAYKPDASKSKIDAASKELSGSTTPLLEQMVMKLDAVDLTMRLVAKNTMAMPGMSRDMNIMRQNVVKLVKLQGGKASTRADSFFLRAFERERATEAELQAAKERRATGKTTAPTALKEKISGIPILGPIISAITAPFFFMAEKLKKFFDGFMDNIGDFFSMKKASSLFGSILKGLVSGLGKFGRILLNGARFLGGTGLLPIIGLAALAYGLYKLIDSDKGEGSGETPSASTPEERAPAAGGAPELDAVRPTTEQELKSARERLRSSSDASERQAAVELDRSSPLSTSPTPLPITGFEKMAVDMIKKHEGLPKNGKAYKDAHGHSIGYGHFITPLEKERGYIIAGDEKIPIDPNNILNTTITPQQAEKLLAHDLPKYINAAKVPLGEAWEKLNDSQKAALVSSAYNTGQGGIQHLVKKGLKDAIMRGDFEAAGKIIKEHGFKTAVMDGQRQTVSGLVRRRAEEGAIVAGQTSGRSDQLIAASSAVSDARQEMSSQPTVVNAPTNNNIQNNSNGQGGSTGKPASAYDRELSQALLGLIT